MKNLLLLFIALVAVSCSNPYRGVSEETAKNAKKAIESTNSKRSAELKSALELINPEYREGMAFLIAYMPKYDLDTLSTAVLTKNVELAYKARNTFSWTKDIPEDVFLNDVLPYSSMDETRENWREGFYEMLYPIVKDAPNIYAAIDTLNKSLMGLVKVEYNTNRKKANQSPSESMSQGMASCSGLSIILTDAFRAVGIPSRIAGTPNWVTREGNHNWSEVWADGQWYFTEYYYTPLNHSWFLEKAAKADANDPETWMYATSFKPTGTHFPMVWSLEDTSIPGYDVTQRYRDIYASQVKESDKGTPLNIKMYKDNSCTKTSSDRVVTNVTVKNSKGEVIGEGKTVGVNADMNDYLSIYITDLEDTYTIEWEAVGKKKSQKIKITEQTTVDLTME